MVVQWSERKLLFLLYHAPPDSECQSAILRRSIGSMMMHKVISQRRSRSEPVFLKKPAGRLAAMIRDGDRSWKSWRFRWMFATWTQKQKAADPSVKSSPELAIFDLRIGRLLFSRVHVSLRRLLSPLSLLQSFVVTPRVVTHSHLSLYYFVIPISSFNLIIQHR